jgi:hypothetical protein
MVNEEEDYEWKNTDTDEWGIHKHKWDHDHKHKHQYRPHSLSDIGEVVRKDMKRKGISWDTIIGHLDDIKDAGWVEEDPKRGSNNERYFRLTQIRLHDLDLMRYFFEHTPPPVAIMESESP